MNASQHPVELTATDLETTVTAGLEWLYDRQDEAGFWVGILESNSCMEAEWILALHFLGLGDHHLIGGLARAIRNDQREDGSWETYHDAPTGDINSTVESYVALRATGIGPEEPAMVKAREWILGNGGLAKVRVFTRYWLALIGEWPWDCTPNVPPEVIFAPRWLPFNIYNFASWARATLVPIAVLSARRPVRPLPEDRRPHELFPEGRSGVDFSLPRKSERALSEEQFFLGVDRVLHRVQSAGLVPRRERAVRQCLDWIVRHQDSDGAWGGIQPPWIYSLMALHNEGYSLDHPVLEKGLGALDGFWSYEHEGGVCVQACNSPVWDTWLTLLALLDCGIRYETSPAMRSAVEWLLGKQVTAPGDWQVKVKGVAPGGWSFEHANDHYPDLDDTAVALIVLARVREQVDDPQRIDRAIELARNWVLAMQCANGGWAAFDKDNDQILLTRIPFSDFGETLDPPSVDVTAHVLEGLGMLGLRRTDPAVAKALAYIRAEQEPEGSWFGRWGVNHIYGTAAVLPALRAVGEDMSAAYVRRAAEWVASRQNPDGGWGESCISYMDDAWRGRWHSTASQTGWGLMALIAVGDKAYGGAIERGVDYLTGTQRRGTWDEPQYTGTGFPGYGIGARADLEAVKGRGHQGAELSRGFMINYNLYRHYFPLMALGRARVYFAST